MDRSSKAITLALIGGALALGGCSDPEAEGPEEGQAAAGTQNAGHGARGVMILPRMGGMGGGGGIGGGVATSPSARGGFGSTGAASVGS